MTTPSGQISLSDIQTEFGGSNPIGINEYYAGAGYVASGISGIPLNGQISFNDLRSKSNTKIVTAPSSTILYNVDVYQALVDNGWDRNVPAVYTIPDTTYITSTTTASAALRIAGTYPNGITIVNNGYILGRGGDGGGSGGGGGAPGGTAIYTATTVTINNTGTIAGGGGGGGAGQTGDNYSSGGGGGGAPFGANGGSSYYSGGSSSTISTAGIADMTMSNLPYGGYGIDRWGCAGGNGGGWGQAGISGNSGAGRNGPGAGGRAGQFVEGYELVTFTNRGTLLGEFSFAGYGGYVMSNMGINPIVGGGNLLGSYLVTGSNNPGVGTSLVDDNYWGRIDPRKTGYANFDWYLFGVNLMAGFYIGSNSFITLGAGSSVYTPTRYDPPFNKILFNGRDLQTYSDWINPSAYSNDAFRLFFLAELYNSAGNYDAKELVFFNPQRTGGKMVLLIKCGGNGSSWAFQGGGTSLIANDTGTKSFNFSSLMGPGKNVLCVGDSNGDNWVFFNGYLRKQDGTIVNN